MLKTGIVYTMLMMLVGYSLFGCAIAPTNLMTCGKICNSEQAGMHKYVDDIMTCECSDEELPSN